MPYNQRGRLAPLTQSLTQYPSPLRPRHDGKARLAALISTSVLASWSFTTCALAQSAPAETASPEAAATEQLQQVVVTGSLIRRPNYTSASPIVSVSQTALADSGQVTAEALLNQLPTFTPAGTAGQNTGPATVNMRGIGTNRNLVLLDGRRLPLADASGNVDINLIPNVVLSGIDVVTGGASAIYGSDALSGVVNFKTLKRFEGVKGDIEYGNTTKFDLHKANVSMAVGASFDEGRGHVLLAVGATDRQNLKGDRRPFFALQTPSSYIGTGTYLPSNQASNLPSRAAVNQLFSRYGIATPVTNTGNLGFNNDGSLFVQNPYTVGGVNYPGGLNYKGPTSGAYAIIGNAVRMPVGPQSDLMDPLDRKSIFATFDFEVNRSMTAYGQFMHVDTTVSQDNGGSLTPNSITTIPVTNPFIPADLATLLASRQDPKAPFSWNTRYVGVPDRYAYDVRQTSQFLFGVKGDLPYRDWSYDAYASWDRTDHANRTEYAVVRSQVQKLLNAADGGNSLCAGGLNIFGLNNQLSLSQSCVNYMTTTTHQTEELQQSQAQATVQGSLFALPAGDLSVAAQLLHRSNSYVASPDFNLVQNNIEGVNGFPGTTGVIKVNEAALQFDVPLLKGHFLANELTAGFAIRRSAYTNSANSSFTANSSEADLKWRPTPNLLLRASSQRAVRAPSIGEAFAPVSRTSFGLGTPPNNGIGDPCDIRSVGRTGGGAGARALCIAQGVPANVVDSYFFPTTAAASESGGNPALMPEKGHTIDAGVVWSSTSSSPFLSGLTMSIDYYKIDIKDVISDGIGGNNTLNKCYNLDGSNPTYDPNNVFCKLIVRNASGQIEHVNLSKVNLAERNVSGVDAQISYGLPLSALGVSGSDAKIMISSNLGYTKHRLDTIAPGATPVDYADTNNVGNSFPRLKALTTFAYESRKARYGLNWRYQSAVRDVSALGTTNVQPGVPVYQLFDLFGSYAITDKIRLRGTVTNLMNHAPVFVAQSPNGTDLAAYDAVGRSFSVGMTVKF